MAEAIEFNADYSNRRNGVPPLSRSYGSNNFREASIFSRNQKEELTDVEKLEKKLKKVNKEQGIFQKGFNEVKELLNIGTSDEKCKSVIEQFKNGEITFEEAEAEIDKYDEKQDSGLNVFTNILCAVAAVAAATALTIATGGVGLPVLLAVGAGAGAITKATLKTVDRATNQIDGDDFDSKEITRDMLSGAVTGATAAATMGTGSAATTAGSLAKTTIVSAVKAGAKEGAITGAIASGSNYAIDCAVDGERFDFGEFARTTTEGAVIGAVAGGAIKGSCHTYSSAIRGAGSSSTNASTQSMGRTIARRAFATTRTKLVNKAIRDVA